MECKVIGSNLVRIDAHGACVFLKVEEVSRLRKMLEGVAGKIEEYQVRRLNVPETEDCGPAEERAE